MNHLDDPRDAFDQADLNTLLNYREGQHFDRKRRNSPKDLAQHIVAFANGHPKGGLLLMGVDDDRTVVGLREAYGDDYHNDIARCGEYVTHVTPQYKMVPVQNIKGISDEVALIYVPFSEQLATTGSGDVYLRVGDQSVKQSIETIIQLRQERGQDIPYCNLRSRVLVTNAAFHMSVLKDYQQRLGSLAPGVSLERLLLNQNLAVHHDSKLYLTNAGLLLLTQDPRLEIPGAWVRFLKYQGREPLYGASQNVVQDESFIGPIPFIAQRVQDYLRSQLKQFRYLGPDNRFITVPELPEDAWFEAIINALVHRSYSLVNDCITIRLFDDRLEIISPGSYMIGVNPSDFPNNDVSRPRNVTIMRFMQQIQYVQMLTEGTRRIFGEMQKLGLPDPIYSPPGEPNVKVILKNEIDRRVAAQARDEANNDTDPSLPILNIFRLAVQASSPSSQADKATETPISFHEMRDAIETSLVNNGWSVSSFTHDIAIDLSKPPVAVGGNILSMHEAFRFSLQEFNGKYFLALDFKIEVRSRATLQFIASVIPSMLRQRFGRGFARIENQWVPGFIVRLHREQQTALFEIRSHQKTDPRTRREIPFSEVVPDLNSSQLSELLLVTNNKMDLYRERMRLSNLPSTIRLERIKEISAELSRRIFPITVRAFQIFLSREPYRANPSEFQVNFSLREPAISFANQKLSVEISRGLTTYGSYQKASSDIPLILMGTPEKMPLLERLVMNLQKGSKRFGGFNKTFGANLTVIGKYATSFDNYRETCEQIVPTLSRDPLPLMLVFMPDERGLWSRANHLSPYYQVKHYLLENGIPSQGVDQDTLDDLEWKDLNLALDIFAKTGHVPWVLDEGMPLADVFVGLSYSSIRIKDGLERVIAYVCVFDEFGRWQYYIGNTEPVPFEERDSRLAALIGSAVQRYTENTPVRHIHIHHGHSMKFDTSTRIAEAIRSAAPNANVHFLYVNNETPIRIFGAKASDDTYVQRGTFIQVRNTKKFFLATTGKTELQTVYRGTPVIVQGNLRYFGSGSPKDMTIYGQHVLSLTRLNWASTRSFSAEPITLLYSAKVARYMNIFMQNYGSFSLHPDLIRTPWFL